MRRRARDWPSYPENDQFRPADLTAYPHAPQKPLAQPKKSSTDYPGILMVGLAAGAAWGLSPTLGGPAVVISDPTPPSGFQKGES